MSLNGVMARGMPTVSADRPVRWGDGDIEFGALGLGVTGTSWIGAVVELANQLHRTLERTKVTIPVIGNIHQTTTDWAIAVEDVEFPESEIGIRRPLEGTLAISMPWRDPSNWKSEQEDAEKKQGFLGWCPRIIETTQSHSRDDGPHRLLTYAGREPC